MKNKRRSKGFTLIELVVAIGIMLVLAAVATPFLLGHIKDAKISSMNEQFLNIESAFNSYYLKHNGILVDSDNDSDYLDEMINDGWLSSSPSGKNDLTWLVKKFEDAATGKIAYYIRVESTTQDSYDYLDSIWCNLISVVEGVSGCPDAHGRLQLNEDVTVTPNLAQFNYLLKKEPGMGDTWQD